MGVGVKVEQRARALNRGSQILQIVQHVAGADVPIGRLELDDAGAVGQAQAASVDPIDHFLDPGDRPRRQEREQPVSVERRAVGKPQHDRAGVQGPPATPGSIAQPARGQREHLFDRRIELPHAAKARGERDLGDRQRGRLEQQARRLRPLSPGERERTDPDDTDELAVHVTRGVSQPAGEAGDTLAVDNAIGDQPHRPSDQIGPTIPLGRSGRCVRTAAHARAEARGLRRGG